MTCDRKAEEGHSSVSTESNFFVTWPFSGRHLLIPELGQRLGKHLTLCFGAS